METYFSDSAKNCEQQHFETSKSIVISEASINGIEEKVSTMLEEVVVLFK